MRKFTKAIALLLSVLILISAAVVSVCAENETNGSDKTVNESAVQTTVKFASTEKTVTFGNTAAIKATVKNGKGKTVYTSSDENVAAVDSKTGKITANGVGTANITAENNGVAASYTITVSKAPNPITVKAVKSVFTAKYNKETKLTAAQTFKISDSQGNISYAKRSGNKKITISSSGNIVVKAGLKKNTYTIKVKVTAKGNANYKSGYSIAAVKIKVK